NFPILIARKDDALSYDMRGEKGDLLPVSETTFFTKDNWEFAFASDSNGKIRGLAIRDDLDRELVAFRTEKRIRNGNHFDIGHTGCRDSCTAACCVSDSSFCFSHLHRQLHRSRKCFLRQLAHER